MDMPNSLSEFSPDGDDVYLTLARAWAESTQRLLSESIEMQRVCRNFEYMLARNDGDGFTNEGLQSRIRSLWATDCLLVLSAANLEDWVHQLFRNRGRALPERRPLLKQLRNAIEHLDESEIDSETWVASPSPKQLRFNGIQALPEGTLQIGLNDSNLLFGAIEHQQLEEIASQLLAELDAELEDYVVDWFQELYRGR